MRIVLVLALIALASVLPSAADAARNPPGFHVVLSLDLPCIEPEPGQIPPFTVSPDCT